MADPVSPPDTLDGYCLAEEVIHALACGALEETQRSRALAHLDDCELCQALLADEVRGLPESPSAEDAGLPTLIQLGSLVAGRYRIKRFLARGGMGEVYEAWDVLLSERVALKTINPLTATADQAKASARFRQEVQLSRRVADPHVCRIYEFGEHVVRGFGALSYLTMEFIEGETLGARLRQGPRLDMHDVVELSRQMLRGLAAAHSVGVLHRDFKSDNVMLRTKAGAPDELHAVIMDFGLARVLGDQAHRLTERHEFIGSAAYMAPEQLEEGASLSAATDLYAFGVVLFEMLTGRLPFEGKGAVAVALRRLTHAAPPPSLYTPELSSDWDTLVARCLHRDVSRRFASTEQVAAALEGVAGARHVALPTRRSRRRALTLAGAAAATASVALAAAHFWPRPPAPVAVSPPAPQSTTLALQPPVEPARPEAVAPIAQLPPPPVAAAEPLPSPPPDPVPEPPPRAHRPAPRATPPKPRAVASVEPATAAAAANPAVPAPVQSARDVRDIFFLEPPSDGRAQNAPE